MAIALPRWAIASWKAERRKRLIARLAPPFDREIVEAGLGEMMGDDFRLGRRGALAVATGFPPRGGAAPGGGS